MRSTSRKQRKARAMDGATGTEEEGDDDEDEAALDDDETGEALEDAAAI